MLEFASNCRVNGEGTRVQEWLLPIWFLTIVACLSASGEKGRLECAESSHNISVYSIIVITVHSIVLRE